MNKRNLILAILVLVSAVLIFLVMRDRSATGAGGELKTMLPESTAKVNRIGVIRSADTLKMFANEGNWELQDGEILNREVVEHLLYCVAGMRVQSIISAEELAGQQDRVRVTLYRSNKKLADLFLVEYREKNFIVSEGGKNAYMVELPGYDDLRLRKVFSADADHFREYLLFSLLPPEIAEVSVDPLQGSSFTVKQDSSARISVHGPAGEELEYSDRKVRLLLSYFNTLRFEGYLPGNEVPGDLNLEEPDATVFIKEFSGTERRIEVFRWLNADGEPDIFRALVSYNDAPGLLIVNYSYLDLLIRGHGAYVNNKP